MYRCELLATPRAACTCVSNKTGVSPSSLLKTQRDLFSLRLRAVDMGCSKGAGKPSMPRTVLRRSLSPLAGCRKSPSSRLEAQKDPFSLGLGAIGAGAGTGASSLLRAGCRRKTSHASPEGGTEDPQHPTHKGFMVLGRVLLADVSDGSMCARRRSRGHIFNSILTLTPCPYVYYVGTPDITSPYIPCDDDDAFICSFRNKNERHHHHHMYTHTA